MSSKEESFQLSIGAQNVEAKFYGKLAIVYVEGPDDKVFWSQYFDKRRFEIRKKDGCRNLDDIIDAIVNKGLKQIVACDADYSFYEKSQISHPLVVMTVSHSIESIMYCPVNLNACVQKLARDIDDHLDEINVLYEMFSNDIKELLVYDIVNNVYRHGESIFGDSCVRFLKSNHSTSIDKDKVCELIKKNTFPADEIKQVEELMEKDKRSIRQIAKGHFQTGFVTNLLKQLSSSISGDNCGSISSDSLFALLVKCTPDCSVDCEERDSLRKKVERAVQYLT